LVHMCVFDILYYVIVDIYANTHISLHYFES
jgi:hypothetical protein